MMRGTRPRTIGIRIPYPTGTLLCPASVLQGPELPFLLVTTLELVLGFSYLRRLLGPPGGCRR